jgi:hypothetical protein
MKPNLLSLVVALMACGGSSNIEKMVQEGESFTERLCACTDAGCVQTVYDELEAWKTSLPKLDDEEAKMSPEARAKIGARIKASSSRSKECLAKWKGQYRRRG